MKESWQEELATHLHLNPYADGGDIVGVASGRGTGRPAIELRNQHFRVPTLWCNGEGNTSGRVTGERSDGTAESSVRCGFDNIDHTRLLKFLERGIGDKRILRLIRKWLTAGISEDGEWLKTTVSTPQGAAKSPLPANVYLHYVFDLWIEWWRRHHSTGTVVVIRYVDDFVIGFEHRTDADRCLDHLGSFLDEVKKLWLHALRRRSHTGRDRWPWSRFARLAAVYLPRPRILHPHPWTRFHARLKAGVV